MPYRILPREPVRDAIRRIADEQLARAIGEIDDASLDAVETVHQVRKRCKALRGLLRLVRPQLGDVYARENAFYRDAARDLSDVRDAQVALETFEQLLAHFAPTLDEPAFEPLRAALRQQRESSDEQHDLTARLALFRARMEEGRERLATWCVADEGFDAVADGFALTYRRGREAMRAAARDPDTESIHEWRKRAKYHWYHMRLLRGLWEAPMKALRREIRALSELLGHDHDLAVLRETVLSQAATLGEPTVVETVVGLSERRQAELRTRAATLGGRIYAERPKALLRRLEVLWGCWSDEGARENGAVRETGRRSPISRRGRVVGPSVTACRARR